MMDNQNYHKLEYKEYKQLLERAKTFLHLVFYNRKLINNYFLSSYGFRLSLSRDGHKEAKCADCGTSFLLDPILQQTAMEVKESFMQVIGDHEDTCRFWRKMRGNQIKHGSGISKNNIKQFGVQLFWEIVQHNFQQNLNVDEFFKYKGKIGQVFSKQEQKWFQKLTGNNKDLFSAYALALFGWKIDKNMILSCQYCGYREENPQKFEPIQSHRSFCLLLNQSIYSRILQTLAINSLNDLRGQFLKSQGQVYAKKIRTQLQKMTEQPTKVLRQFKLRIKQIKSSVQTIDTQQLSAQKRDRQILDLDKIQNFAQQIQESIKNAIKKVKID